MQEGTAPMFYQYSMTQVLEASQFEGSLTIAEAAKHGDFGLGVFNGLDGEMAVVDGEFYQIFADGTARLSPADQKVPFISLVFFKPSGTFEITAVPTVQGLWDALSLHIHGESVHAIRIDGEFQFIRARSVPRQRKPYPSIEEVNKVRTVFERRSLQGTLVGFKCPATLAGTNTAGYHLHFIDSERRWGGHLLECSADKLTVHVQSTRQLRIDLLADNSERSE